MQAVQVKLTAETGLALGFLLVSTLPLLVSCAAVRSDQAAVRRMQQRAEQFRSIRDGMTEQEVRANLGRPDEVRVLSPEHPLGGITVLSSQRLTPETHRWAYEPLEPGGFARRGIVSFDAAGTVVASSCPPTGSFEYWFVKPERVRPSGGDITVEVKQVRLEEAHGLCPRCWWVQIAVINRGTNQFSRKCFWESFNRQVAVEIFDKKGLLYREDLTGIQNGMLSRDSTFVLPPGASKSEEIPFFPEEYLGRLPPAKYQLRAYFAEGTESFVASAPYKVTVRKSAKASEKPVGSEPIQARRNWGNGSIVLDCLNRQTLHTALTNAKVLIIATHGGDGYATTWYAPEVLRIEPPESGASDESKSPRFLRTRVLGPDGQWSTPDSVSVNADLKLAYIFACDGGAKAAQWKEHLAPAQVITYDRVSTVWDHTVWFVFTGPPRWATLR